jgi:hypothetical protein
MNQGPQNNWADRLPKANYFEKSLELVASFDNLMVTLFSALIAGIVLLLLKEEVSLWVGSALFLALTCFVFGIGHTLIHIAFTSKLLLLAEALRNGTEVVPNPVEQEELTIQAYARNQAFAQRAYSAQLIYLLIGIGFGALAVMVRLWDYAWRAGVVGLAFIVILSGTVALIVTWKKTIRRFRSSGTAQKQP